MAAGCPHCGDWKHLGTECPLKPKGWKPGMPGLLEEKKDAKRTPEGQHEQGKREAKAPKGNRRPEKPPEDDGPPAQLGTVGDRPRDREAGQEGAPEAPRKDRKKAQGEVLTQTRDKAKYQAYQRAYQRKRRERIKADLEELRRLRESKP